MPYRTKSLVISPNVPEPKPDKTGFTVNDSDFLPVQEYPTNDRAVASSVEVDLPVDNSTLEESYASVSGSNPDQAAEVFKYANKLNENPQFVRNNLDSIKRADSQPQPSFFSELEKNYPGTTQFLSDPNRMAVAQDDLPNLAMHEKLFKGIGDSFESIKQSGEAVLLQEELGFLSYQQAFPDSIFTGNGPRLGGFLADKMGYSVVPEARQAQIRNRLQELAKTQSNGILGAPGDLAVNLATQGISGFTYGLKYAAPSAALAAAGGAFTGPGAAPAAATGFVYGETAGTLEYNYRMMSGLTFDNISQMKDSDVKPLPPETVKAISVVTGAGLSGLGLVKLGAVMKAIPGGSRLLQQFMSQTSEEILGNAMTRSQALQDFGRKLLSSALRGGGAFATITAGNIAAEEYAKSQGSQALPAVAEATNQPRSAGEIAQTIATEGLKGAAGTALLGLPLGALGLRAEMNQAKKVEQAKAFMMELGNAGEESKLRQRMPEEYKNYVAEVTKDGPVENVYVPKDAFDKYFQSKGMTPEVVANELGVSQSYAETKATGGNVEIPLANWTDKLVGTEHHANLLDDIKFNQDDRTNNQLIEAQEEQKNKAAELIKRGTESEAPSARQKIEQDVREKALSAGRQDAEAAHNAKLHGSYFSVLGDVLGLDPYGLYKKYDLQIQKGKRPELVPTATQGENDPRGIFYHSQTNNSSVIALLERADKSTLLHESGHLFLEAARDAFHILEGSPDLNDVQTDFLKNSKALLDWLGVKSFDEVKADQHEKFAQGFEQYLHDGKAPSLYLKKTFSAFKRWLTQIYGKAKDTGIELSPDVREIFDRMFATQEEISAAELEAGYSREEMNRLAMEKRLGIVDHDAFEKRAREDAESQLLKEQMVETEQAHKDFLKSERRRIEENADQQIKETVPVFRAIEAISNELGIARGKIEKFAHDILNDKVKEKTAKGEEFSNLGKLEALAVDNGFDNRHELAKNIIVAEKNRLFELEKNRMVEDGMKQHADMMTTEKIRDRSLEIIHGEKYSDLLALEAQMLDRMIREREEVPKNAEIRREASRRMREEARALARAMRENAKVLLGKLPSKHAGNFRKYITAEREAAQRVTKAIEKGDLAAASKAKQEQMISHALAAEAMRNKPEANKIISRLTEMGNRRADLKNMPYGYVRHIDALIRNLGLSERPPEDAATMQNIARQMLERGENANEIANATGQVVGEDGQLRPETLKEFIDRINGFRAIELPPEVYEANGDYRDVTLDQLRAVNDSVKAISYLGKKLTSFISVDNKADMKLEGIKMAEEVKKLGQRYAEDKLIGSRKDLGFIDQSLSAATSLADKAIPQLVNLLSICKYLDARQDPETGKWFVDTDGPAHNFIYRILKNAENNKLERIEKMRTQVNELLGKYYTPEEFSKLGERREYHSEIDTHLSREELLSLVANWGTESNRDRVLNSRIAPGVRITEQQVQLLINKLSKKEMDFLQGVWDHFETYWPESVELQMRIEGVEPKKVKAAPIQTPHGEYRGGYYPIAYDPAKSIEALKTAEQKSAEYKSVSVARGQTEQGRLKERQAYVDRQLKLKLGTMFDSLEDTIHDLSYRDALIDVNSFIRQKEVYGAITDVIGIDGFRAIEKAIDHVAAGSTDDFSGLDRFVTWMKNKVTPVVLGFRIVGSVADVVGNLGNAGKQVGAIHVPGMIRDFVTNRSENVKFVEDASAFMRHRAEFIEKDIPAIKSKWENGPNGIPVVGKAIDWARTHTYLLQVKADEAISYPLWMQIYRENVGKYGHEKAVHMADESIVRGFGSGSAIDQVGVQRYTGIKSVASSFYSWQSMMFNQAWLDGKIAGLEYRSGNRLNAAKVIATSFMYLWGYQSLQENVIKEFARNNKGEDEEAKARRILARTLQHPLGYVWVARDLGGYVIESKIAKQPNASYNLSPIEQGFMKLVKPLTSNEIKLDDVIDSAGILTATPAQITNWAHNYIDWLNNNGDFTWRDLISRRTKK